MDRSGIPDAPDLSASPVWLVIVLAMAADRLLPSTREPRASPGGLNVCCALSERATSVRAR